IPDECDIADGTSEDCNGNGVPDECDIQSGVSEDCNGNGIPDECDLSVGTSQDCNSNNIPDECDVRPEVGSLVWSEDFESGLGNWSASGLWRLEVGHECLSEDGSLTTVTRAAYNDPSQCTYDVGETSGVLELTTDVVVPATGGALFWYNWVETEDLPPYDGWRLEVSSDGGSTWQEVFDGKGLSRPYWQELWADVSAYAGQSIRVRFVFDSLDDEFNDYLGWYVDDVRLYELAGAATSSDCNINGIPDECEVDCNGNGVPDDCDLVDGTSEDCNGNAVPDECDIQSGTSEDCNTNGIPDECDLSSGTSQDCNANGIPDECDLASGASEDCNGNGIPDECDIADGTS
ncbi:MAG: immune inhibitor A, partial [Candidatus Sumerlaea chitinivorans]|nr:immune inhibitor A [Candidatus Sumerlaea chitinivorans]